MRSIHLIPYVMYSPTFIMGYHDDICVKVESSMGRVDKELLSARMFNGKYFLHCEDAPAARYIVGGEPLYMFAIDGCVCKIENLPCDNETKMLLKIKYGDCNLDGIYK